MASDPSTTPSNDSAPRRNRVYRLNGVTLRHHNLGETDRILTVFTLEHGKRRFVAKGIRRPGSSLAGQLEPFTRFHSMAARSRSLDILSQPVADELFPEMRTSEVRIATANLIAELVDSLTADDQEHPSVFELLVAALKLLDQGESPQRVSAMFTAGLLRELGYRPELYRCDRCGKDVEPVENGFDAIAGSVLCADCRPRSAQSRPLSVNALKLLRLLDRGEISRFMRVGVDGATVTEVEDLLAWYVSTIVGRESAARRVIREMRLAADEYRVDLGKGEPDGVH